MMAAALLPASSANAVQPVVWVFGTSIPAGIGTSGAGFSWPDRYAQLTGAKVRVFAVGGATLDGGSSLIEAQVRRALAQFPGEKPSKVFVDAGTNDMVSHDDLSPVLWAVIGLDLILQTRGVHGTYLTILPMGYGSSHPDSWVPILTARAQRYNTWLKAMGAGGAFPVDDMSGVLHEGSDGILTSAWLERDGLHPNDDAALMIAAALADTN